jgi:hypothetical protein
MASHPIPRAVNQVQRRNSSRQKHVRIVASQTPTEIELK